MDIEVVKVEIAKLHVGPDDIVVIRVPSCVATEELMDEWTNTIAPFKINCWIVPDSLDISILSKED